VHARHLATNEWYNANHAKNIVTVISEAVPFIRQHHDGVSLPQWPLCIAASEYATPGDHEDLVFPGMRMVSGGTSRLYLEDTHGEGRGTIGGAGHNAHNHPRRPFPSLNLTVVLYFHVTSF
jgi:hypothetical protein